MTSNRILRRILAGLSAIVVALIILLAGVWWGGHPSALPSPLRGSFFQNRSLVLVNQALDILTTRYYRPLTRSGLVDHGLSGMVAGLDDRYSHYLDPQMYRDRNQPPQRDQGGIGITTVAEADGLRVSDVFENSPAARAGLMPGDLIVKVGATSLADHADNSGIEMIRGPIGTRVEITFRRGGTDHAVSIERAKIVQPVASLRMVTYDGTRIGHLTFTGFSEDSGDKLRAQVRTALDAGAQALILDLRGNGGGLISEAINVASIFISHGEIMSAVERGQPRRVYTARDDAIAPRIPMVVLVDEGTASSAEIVTAALQDNHRAQVVGTETYGKGVFQVTERLVNGGAIDLTVGKYFTPNGQNLGGGGARPGSGISPNVYARNDPDTPADEALTVAERTVAAERR